MEWFGVAIAGQACGELIGRFSISHASPILGGKQDNLIDRNDAPIMLGRAAQNVANFVGETKVLAIHHALARCACGLIGFRPLPVLPWKYSPSCSATSWRLFTTSFDRIVIHGYLSALSRPEQVVHFFRQVLGIPVVSKEILSQRTADYQNWVEAFARNHHTPIAWAEKGRAEGRPMSFPGNVA